MKKRNHFDEKDMILLVVTIIIIYVIFMWMKSGVKPSDINGSSQEPSVTTESTEN